MKQFARVPQKSARKTRKPSITKQSKVNMKFDDTWLTFSTKKFANTL